MSFCRIDERATRVREPIVEPEAPIIVDPTLLHQVDVFGGLRADDCVRINTSRNPGELGLDQLPARL